MIGMEMIKIYTAPHCSQCTATKRKLDQLNIKYELVDVDENITKELVDMGFKQLPVVITYDDKWSGFRPDKIEKYKVI